MNDIQKFSNTERLYTAQFGGTQITDSRQWEIDADVLMPDGKTVSVKDQLKSSAKYGNIAVEAETSNPDNGETKLGWLHYIGTTGFATLCEHPETKEAGWLRCTPAKLQSFVTEHESSLRKYNLTPWTVQHNRQQGRTFVDGWGYLIPVKKLLSAGFHWTPLNQQYNT